ncbi:uncharacterized protein BX664DRAFT_311640 [Halteromyces radiatus]|uniref:uncharacterized protein n=1 Tax=Halteromyces radiatus TaxID=101107 RepID=UPI00221F4A24|nr:uncharacterized protein BX664DRAFT_311640 [Halteromyces radiatus]KAI8096724.1 hypothetical protein BX664DRAFT_311640 [Halteromyces radiatus]
MHNNANSTTYNKVRKTEQNDQQLCIQLNMDANTSKYCTSLINWILLQNVDVYIITIILFKQILVLYSSVLVKAYGRILNPNGPYLLLKTVLSSSPIILSDSSHLGSGLWHYGYFEYYNVVVIQYAGWNSVRSTKTLAYRLIVSIHVIKMVPLPFIHCEIPLLDGEGQSHQPFLFVQVWSLVMQR